MKNLYRKIFTFILFLYSINLFSQNTFQKAIGGKGEEKFYALEKTPDNGYIMCGYTKSFGSGGKDILIVKTDNDGFISWAKTFGGSSDDEAYHIYKTTDNAYIISGYTNSFGSGGKDAFLIKIDNSGNVSWSMTYGTTADDAAIETIEADNGFMFIGTTKILSSNFTDAIIVNTDKDGNFLWGKVYGESENDLYWNILRSTDGNFIACGSNSESGGSIYNGKILKFDGLGNIIWYKAFDGAAIIVARSIVTSNDGGYMLSGMTNNFSSGDLDFLVMKINESGDFQWGKTYGGTSDDGSQWICNVDNKGYLMSGSTESFGFGGRDVYTVRIDNTGNLLWSKAYGGSSADATPSLMMSYRYKSAFYNTNKGFTIGENTTSFGAGSSDIYFIQTDTLGDIPKCNVYSPTTASKAVNISFSPSSPPIQSDYTFVASQANFAISNINLSDTLLCSCNLTVNLGRDTSFCPDKKYNIDAGSNYSSYLWNDNSQNQVLSVSQTGTYSVTVSDKNNCKDADSINILIYPEAKVSLGKDTTKCYNKTIYIDAGNNYFSYLWNDNSHNQYINANKPGSYSVTITDNNGCKASDTIVISEFPVSFLNLGKDTSLCNINMIQLNADNGFKYYLWQDSLKAQNYTVQQAGKYWLEVTDKWNCIYTDTIEVTKDCGSKLVVPNVFTPNNDGKNDVFYCKAYGIENFHIMVFNRWGALIYESDIANMITEAYYKIWDGTFHNSAVPDGVYSCVITYEVKEKNKIINKTLRTSVTIIH